MEPIIKKDQINLAMVGMVDANGHPYSWSAIVNGYDREAMAQCPFPVIPVYLGQQRPENFGIPGVKVTHIWTDDPSDAEKVARAARIEHIVSRPEDVIGKVDAVVIPTDRGDEHVRRARPFVEAGIPVFIDKPLADNLADLRVFTDWVKQGAHILSGSSLRYHKAYVPYHIKNFAELGDMRLIVNSMQKSWERYGMHVLEGIYPITGPGYLTVQNTGVNKDRNIVHLTHRDGYDVVLASIYDMTGTGMILCGTAGAAKPTGNSTFQSFKQQLVNFVNYLRTGQRPFPFEETVEMCKIIAAGTMSREQGGRKIVLDELEV